MGLYSYQQEALEKLTHKEAGALFFEMGLGKTKTSLELYKLKKEAGYVKRCLVIAPNGIHLQWIQTIQEDMPDVISQVVDSQNKKLFYEGTEIIVSALSIYSLGTAWKTVLDWFNKGDKEKTMLIVDESATIKNLKTNRTQKILNMFNEKPASRIGLGKKIAKHRLILSGIPITKNVTDLYSQFCFLEPNFFGMSFFAFQNRYIMQYGIATGGRTIKQPITEDIWRACKAASLYDFVGSKFQISLEDYKIIKRQTSYQGAVKRLEEIMVKIEPCTCYKKLCDVKDFELPEKIYRQIQVEMTKEQRKAYNDIARDLITWIGDDNIQAKTKLAALTKLQQISSGFAISTNGYVALKSNKLEKVVEIVDNSSVPIIIMTCFQAEALALEEELKKLGKRVAIYTGVKESSAYEIDTADVFIGNIQKAGRGLNLQRYKAIVFLSNPFSYELRAQAEARIHRLGQKDTCIIYDVVTSAMDKKVLNAISIKEKQANSLSILNEFVQDTNAIMEAV